MLANKHCLASDNYFGFYMQSKLNLRTIFNFLLSIKFSLLASILLSVDLSAAVDPSQLKKQCENITPKQRQMASMAGYNVDELCSSLGDLSAGEKEKKKEIKTVMPRGTQVETSQRGVIGEEEDDEKTEDEKKFERKRMTTADFTRVDGLNKYGYDLFAGVPTTFAPATDIPVPVDYIMGPGDQLKIQLLGKINEEVEVEVGRDGMIQFPELGPISFAGLNFTEAKARIQNIVKEQMIGVRAVVSLGEIRSIRVFVLGEAFQPGSYTVSALSTMTNALFVSGGIKEVGSLRNIQLKRRGKVITTLDLYDLLQKGDTTGDVRLQPGDVIYIPPVGKTVGIMGEVKRPAIYELKNNHSLQQLVSLAGGYSSSAYPNISHITRKSRSGFTTVMDVDLSRNKAKKTKLENGDLVEISTVLKELEDVVILTGAFHRPRAVKWKKGLKLSHVISSVREFEENTDLNIALIIRKKMPLREVSVLHFNLKDVIERKVKQDIELQPLDEIITFQLYSRHRALSLDQEIDELKDYKKDLAKIEQFQQEQGYAGLLETAEKNKQRRELEELIKQDNIRTKALYHIVKRLREQTSDGRLVKVVDIRGNVRFPGSYPLSENMNIRDLILLAGGLKEASYLGGAEVTRRDLSDRETASIEHINVVLAEELMGSSSFELQSKDKLAVYATPEYRENLSIVLEGEVRFPGEYDFRRGETLTQVVARAGGFTAMAHINAAVFTRRDLRLQEAKRLKELRERMKADIAASDLEEAAAGKGGSSVSNSEQLLNALSESEAVGRLVISLQSIVNSEIDDIQLKDGDRLIIPSYRQEISVLGEVQHSTSHLFNEQWTLEDYLEKSGGLTKRADDDRIYVVKADGSVFLPTQSGWLTHQNKMLSPGDTIVVPLDAERMKTLTLWTSVTQIIYQMAIGVAAIKAL